MDYKKICSKRDIIKKLHSLTKNIGDFEQTWKEKEHIIDVCSEIGSNVYGINYEEENVVYSINPGKANNKFIENMLWAIFSKVYRSNSDVIDILLNVKFKLKINGKYEFTRDNTQFSLKLKENILYLEENSVVRNKIILYSSTDYNVELLKIICEYKLKDE